ncbi:MAG: glycoside hydrolase family 57 protein [Planctomycetota bacterium]
MAQKIYLSFLWHHHQPYYRDTVTGEFWMPWVRLHGIKDYFGMAALLDEFPKIKANINLVPSLLKQIQEYIDGSWDRGLLLGRKPAKDLTDADKQYLLDNLFMAHPDNMVGRFQKYKELYLKWQKGIASSSARTDSKNRAGSHIKDFTEQDFIDLVVLANLAWFHPILKENDPLIKSLIARGRGFNEDDKQAILDKQIEVLGRIVPMHKKLQDEGRAEITTTPFYHPILPLLCDMQSAKVAMPGVKLPVVNQADFRSDAKHHVAEAVKMYRHYFGCDPQGMWPAEGSVSPDILPLLAEQGIKWFATDEEILGHTLGMWFERDGQGILNNPEMLYKPYCINVKDKPLHVVFRDQSFSNLVSFQYQHWGQEDAARHFVSQIKANAARVKGNEPVLVSVILDGENPWEYYQDNGIVFIRTLYKILSDDKDIETVRMSDFIKQFPPKSELKTIYSGSWINHNFAIWAGDQEDYNGWEYLSRAREAARNNNVNDKSMENIYIAEGSDWFWWFGPEHSSAMDTVFDALFRKNLMNVYLQSGLEVPEYLYTPIKQKKEISSYTQPWGYLEIKLDGRVSDYFEWLAAGHYEPAGDSARVSTMDYSEKLPVKAVYFGFSKSNIFFRIDPTDSKDIYFAINFLKPQKRKIIIHELSGEGSCFSVYNENSEVIGDKLATVKYNNIIELSCPLETLGFKGGDKVELFIELTKGDKPLATYPGTTPIGFKLPVEEFDHLNWIA